jgi:hypothetical protein
MNGYAGGRVINLALKLLGRRCPLEFVWKIKGYNGTEKILDQTIALNSADEMKITSLLKELASKNLTPSEISAGLADVHKDDAGGNRIIFHAGQNPHYVAGLWRSDKI